MKVVKPGGPIPAGIREKLESIPPNSARGPSSTRPSMPPEQPGTRTGRGTIPPEKPGTRTGRGTLPPEKPGTRSGALRPGSISPEKPGTRSAAMTIPPSSRNGGSVRPSAPPPVRSAQLDEVERALSLLGGRHPDAERVEREVRAEREWRQKQVAEEAKLAIKRRRVRRVVQSLVGIGLVASGIVGFRLYVDRDRNETAIEARSQLYTAHGFAPLVAPKWPNGAMLDAEIDSPACLVAVGTGVAAASLEVTRGTDVRVTSGVGGVALCACPGDHVRVRSTDPASPMVRLLRVEPRAIGGQVGLAFLQPKPSMILPAAPGPSCSPGALESWLAEGHGAVRTDLPLDKTPGRTELAAVGFELSGSATRADPIMLVPGKGEACVLAVSTAEEDALTLRLGGVEPPQMHGLGRVAWCGTRGQVASVEGSGAGDLVAYSVSAAQVGGSLGVAEWTKRAHVAPAFSAKTDTAAGTSDWPYVAPLDLAWDALTALRASGAPEAKITAGADMVQWVADARLASLATAPGGDIQPADGAPMYGCSPEPGPRGVCSEAGPTSWQLTGAPGHAAVAQAGMPFWLGALDGIDAAGAQESAAHLLAFARRLHAMGFAPTTIDHMTELDVGVDVAGRPGEDEIIAVGVGTIPPFIVPYTDAAAWSLDGDPRIVPLASQDHVHLAAAASGNNFDIIRSKRRTVVFRHAIVTASLTASPKK